MNRYSIVYKTQLDDIVLEIWERGTVNTFVAEFWFELDSDPVVYKALDHRMADEEQQFDLFCERAEWDC